MDPTAIGRLVDVTATLSQVTVWLDERVVACHDRVWSTAQTITDPTHVVQAGRLRRAFQHPPAPTDTDLLRDLADYDTAFGVNFDVHGLDEEVV